jgi:PAS domain S-box-containing protein
MARNQIYEELKQRVKELEKEAANHKRAEEALRESEKKYRDLVERVTNVGVLVAQDGKLVFTNTAISDILGYTKEELASHPNPFDFIHPDDRTMVLERHMKRLKGENSPEKYPYRIITRDGSIKWVEVTGTRLDWRGKPATLNFFTDITERKRMEDALRVSEAKYRRLVQQSKDAIFLVGLEDNTFYASPACHDIFGYDADEFMEDSGLPAKIVHPESRRQYNKFWQQYKADGVFPDRVQEWAWVRKDGQTVYTENIFTNIFNEQGMVIGFQTIARDITDRKRSEEALKESEKKYRDLVENISDVIYSIDADGVVTYISPAIESFLGYSPSEIIGTPFIEFVYKKDWPRTRKRFEETLSGDIKPSEYRIVDKFGKIHWILVSSRPVSDHNHIIGIHGVLTNITERKQAEEALLKKDKKLKRQAQHLEEINTALKVLLEHREEEKKKSEENILSNVQKLIFPYIEKLENSRLTDKNKTYVDIIRSNLKDLISPFGNTLSSKYSILTPTEIQVADLIKHGRTSKEIASLLNVSLKAISFHRGNIRKKLGLVNKKINLRSHLQSLAT